MTEFQIGDTEQLYKLTCAIGEYGEKPDYFYQSPSSEKMVSSWKDWYYLNVEIKGYSDGELEKATIKILNIPTNAHYGFRVVDVKQNSVVLASDRELDYGVDDLTQSDNYERWLKEKVTI
jgi:hypothetical protein